MGLCPPRLDLRPLLGATASEGEGRSPLCSVQGLTWTGVCYPDVTRVECERGTWAACLGGPRLHSLRKDKGGGPGPVTAGLWGGG